LNVLDTTAKFIFIEEFI